MQKQTGRIQTRGILSRELEEQNYHRALGLVTITRTTTKWKTSHMDSSYYLETTIQVYLDPTPQNPPSRFRLSYTSTFDGTPRYEPRFDPALRVSNRVRYNDPIVMACRAGDLERVRTLFASGAASPYDCCETDTNISLLDIVFKQLISNMDTPKGPSNYVSKLHVMFKYLVDLGLDPGELSIQHRHPAASKQVKRSGGIYVLRCGYCLEPISGAYYDCKLCVCGDFRLCQPCIEAGQRCHDLGHHEKQPLIDSSIRRTMLHYSPIEGLGSIYYAKENAPYLVDVARTILCCSKQDPFENYHGRLLEWKWYEELVDVESPVLELISKQQEWVFRLDETKPKDPSAIPIIWIPEDPVDLLLRAWTDMFEGQNSKRFAYTYAVFTQVSHLLDSDEVHTEFCIRAAPLIHRKPWCLYFLLLVRHCEGPLWRPSLQVLLNQCIATRYIKGYQRIALKYWPTEESAFSYDMKTYNGLDGKWKWTFFTRRIEKVGESDLAIGDNLGLCLMPGRSGQTRLFYDGRFGNLWFHIRL